MSDTTSGLSAESTARTGGCLGSFGAAAHRAEDRAIEDLDALFELLQRHIQPRRELDRAAVLGDDETLLASPDDNAADVVEGHWGAGLRVGGEVDAGPHSEASDLADDLVLIQRAQQSQ